MEENRYAFASPPGGAWQDACGPPGSRAPSLDALSFNALKRYRSLFDERNEGHPWSHLPDEELLLRLNAAERLTDASELCLTKGGLLMFGFEHDICRVFPGYVLDYRRVSGNGSSAERIVSLDGTWSGCVFDFWMKVRPLLAKAATGARTRPKRPSLADALDAALVNALVHAEYPGRRHVVVEHAVDRVTFSNPGSMRVGCSGAFRGGVADPRNPVLAKIFALIGACANAGEGLELIAAASQAAGVDAPVLAESESPPRTRLTLFLPVASTPAPSKGGAVRFELPVEAQAPKTPAGAPAETPAASLFEGGGPPARPAPQSSEPVSHAAAPRGQLGEDEAALEQALARAHDADARAVLELFRTKRRIRRAEVEELLGIGSTKAKAIVGDLVGSGLIAAEGGGRSTLYRLCEP